MIVTASLGAERAVLITLLALLPILFGALIWFARWRDREPDIPTMLREPPEDVHPVELALMWSAYHHHVRPRTAYRAELVHLARIGAVSLVPVGTVSDPQDFLITFEREPRDEIDRDFVEFLFSGTEANETEPAVSLRSLRRSGGAGRTLLRWWGAAFARVAGAIQRIWMDERPEYYLAFLVGVFAAPLAVVTLTPDYDRLGALAGAVFVLGGAGWLFTAWALPPRLDAEFRARLQRWRAFRRYLVRFPSLHDAPTAGVVIWERYLEDAVALGAAGRVERQVRALDATATLPPPWPGAPHGPGGRSWVRHLWRRGPRHPPEVLREVPAAG